MSPSPVNLGNYFRYPSGGRELRSCGKIRGAYLAAIMASIAVIGGFSPAIGILGGGELRGEGARIGDIGNELTGGRGNNGGFREKAKGIESVDVSLCTEAATVTRGGAVRLGVGKPSVVLGLRQGVASGEMRVTTISPSNPKPGGETSTGTLLKFRKRETLERSLLGNS